MNEEKIIGLGGVGDCLIIIFKLLEVKKKRRCVTSS